MLSFWINAIYALFIEIFRRLTPIHRSSLALFRSSTRGLIRLTGYRPHSSIHTLNNDALLTIFHLYRLDVTGDDNDDGSFYFHWHKQRWWYKLAQVCRRWRYLIFASPLQLHLHLLCTNGVPVVDMLAHSPPLPLIIHYYDHERLETTKEDEEGILLALRHADRLHCISLGLSSPKLQKIIITMDEQFPILERLNIFPVTEDGTFSTTEDDTSLVLPRTFQAPHLRRLYMGGVALPIESPLLMTTVGLVTLALCNIPPSAYFPLSHLLARLSLFPQLKILKIDNPLPNRDVERQLLHTPMMAHITLPNLRVLAVKGVSAYIEGLFAQISAPVLSELSITLSNQLTSTVPRLLQFMDTSEALSFSILQLFFLNDYADLHGFQLGEEGRNPFRATIMCNRLDWQVSSTAQILNTLQPVLSGVEKLTLVHGRHGSSSEWHNEVDCTQWRQLFRPLSNLKTLHVQNGLVGQVARSLRPDDGEPPLALLPNLKEVGYTGYTGDDDARDAFIPLIDERQIAGHPVSLSMIDHLVLFQP